VEFPNILDGRIHFRDEIEKCKDDCKINVIIRSFLTSCILTIAFIENYLYITNDKQSDGTTNSLRVAVIIFNIVMVFFVVKFYR
jgi:hypothetical protein